MGLSGEVTSNVGMNGYVTSGGLCSDVTSKLCLNYEFASNVGLSGDVTSIGQIGRAHV